MRLPPSDDGVAQYKVAPLNEAYTASARGEVGAVRILGATGLARTGVVAVPVPTAFTAETRNEYWVPFVKPVMFAVRAVEAVCAKTVHAVTLLSLYSIL